MADGVVLALGTYLRSDPQEAVIAEIERLVAAGQLKPGDRLPAEREFASALGLSRQSVREALRQLEARGLVRVVHGRGAFISREVPIEGLREAFSTLLLLREISVEELMEARRINEPEIAALAAQRATDRDQAALAANLSAMRLAREPARWAELAEEFHSLLARGSGNRVLWRMMQVLKEPNLICMRAQQDEQRWLAATAEHERIVQAVVARDAQAARQAMADHLERTTRSFMRRAAAASAPGAADGRGDGGSRP